MEIRFLMIAGAATTLLGVSACMNTPESLPPGQYESTHSRTDANGTEYTTEKSTDVTVDQNGNKKAVVKSSTTQDPKGLFNKKTTSSTEETYDENAR